MLTLNGSPNARLHRGKSRGEHEGSLWSPGFFQADLGPDPSVMEATLVASTEPWETVEALTPDAALQTETNRRLQILDTAPTRMRSGVCAELVLAADQFLVTPAARPEDATRAVALGTEARTVIAGYHWFTDWGRDTMISLEGLTLITGREREAGLILRTFASYVGDGLITMFPTASNASIHRRDACSSTRSGAMCRPPGRHTLRSAGPATSSTTTPRHAVRNRRRSADAWSGRRRYQLTGWTPGGDDVITPHGGRPWRSTPFCNALRLPMAGSGLDGDAALRSARWRSGCAASIAGSVRRGQHLTSSWRRRRRWGLPSDQVLAISLPHPVLYEAGGRRYRAVRTRLLTLFGLRTLAPGHQLSIPYWRFTIS
jgi:hypothetical protein